MTIAVDLGRKATKTNKQNCISVLQAELPLLFRLLSECNRLECVHVGQISKYFEG